MEKAEVLGNNSYIPASLGALCLDLVFVRIHRCFTNIVQKCEKFTGQIQTWMCLDLGSLQIFARACSSSLH